MSRSENNEHKRTPVSDEVSVMFLSRFNEGECQLEASVQKNYRFSCSIYARVVISATSRSVLTRDYEKL